MLMLLGGARDGKYPYRGLRVVAVRRGSRGTNMRNDRIFSAGDGVAIIHPVELLHPRR
jgi:hypothetical protein